MVEEQPIEAELLTLIGRTALKDAEAFKRLYEMTAPRAYAVALRVLRERGSAEEAVQDAYVQVWTRAAEYHAGRGSVLAWLLTVVRYRAIDAARRRQLPVAESDNEVVDPDIAPDRLVGRSENADRLADCLRTLSDTQRTGVVLSFLEGLTHEQVAERLTQPIGTVKSRIRRGLLRLRECLQQ